LAFRLTQRAMLAIVIAGTLGAVHLAAGVRTADDWALVLDRPATGKYNDIVFVDANHGWVVGGGAILATVDGGKSWREQGTGLGTMRSIDFLDTKRGFAGNLSGVLYGTMDGGTTWTNISDTLPRRALGFCGITHVGEEVHIVGKYVGQASDYFYSPDAGHTWRYQNLSGLAQALVEVTFISRDVGFIGGMAPGGSNAGPAVMLKTTDGGRTWREVFLHDGGRGYVWKIFPVSRNLIYAALQSQDGVYRIVKSTDLGEHWELITVATSRPLGPGVQALGFLDANTGWVGGFFPGMWATSDGGKTWAHVQMTDATINRFEPVGQTLITAGSRGILRLDRK
jgi:photosystem II stability/assembly factor-like uncharacterized protein